MKYALIYILFLMFVCQSSCTQNQTKTPQDTSKSRRANYSDSQLKEADTSKVPISMVRNVRLARNGDILIASYLGVFRYDGTSFTNLTSTISSARFSSFWDVLEDRKGNLWFASKDSGVYKYDGKSFLTGQADFQHFTKKDGLASDMALHIYEDRAGNIWFEASLYDPSVALRAGVKSFRKFTTKDGFPSNNIRLLLEDNTGKLWFGAQQEDMFVFDGKTFTVLKNKDGKAFNNVWGITEDRKGNIWFGATIIEDKRGDTMVVSQGLWRYDGTTFTKVSDRGAYDIIEDEKGNIWTTGEVKPQGFALSRYDANNLYNKRPTVTEIKSEPGMLLGILEDAKGNIWFGSGLGVYRYDGKTVTDFRSDEKNN